MTVQERFSKQDVGKLVRVISGPLAAWVGVVTNVVTDNKTDRLDRVTVDIPGSDMGPTQFKPSEITRVNESEY